MYTFSCFRYQTRRNRKCVKYNSSGVQEWLTCWQERIYI